jgi:hypothetical protein
LKRIGSKNHRNAAAKVTAELNVHLEDPVSTTRVRGKIHRSNIHRRSAIATPLITEKTVKGDKDGVVIIEPGL